MAEDHGSTRAKLFMNGGSQAVRLPREFRFEGTEVKIRKRGAQVILEPIEAETWPEGFWQNMPGLEEGWERPSDPVPPPIESELD